MSHQQPSDQRSDGPGLSASQTSKLPPLQWETAVWEGSGIAAYGPAAARLASYGTTYKTAMPPLITGLNLELDREVSLLAREAEIELARLDAEAGGRLGSFGPILLRSEAASSSQIENLTASARQIFAAEAGLKGSRNATDISANTRAMIEAIASAERIDEGSILSMHNVLMADQPNHTPGKYRDQPAWIGTRADSPIGATYVAPRSERVQEFMDDLVAFANRTDLPPLEQIAVTHAQFETIHPFSDGNGRTGRALAQSMLRHAHVTRNVVVPVSAGLLTDVVGYHRALTEFRQGDPNPIVHEFGAAALRAVPNTRWLLSELENIREQWHQETRARTGSVKAQMLDHICSVPVFTAEQIADDLGIAASNAYRYLRELEGAGVLAMHVEHRGPRAWRAPQVLSVIDGFAARAGRRMSQQSW